MAMKLSNKSKKIYSIGGVLVVIALFFAVFQIYSANQAQAYTEYLQQGMKYEQAGELDKAIDSYKNASKAAPKEYVPYSNLGTVYKNQKDFVKAEASFRKALEINPKALSVYNKLYELYRYDLRKHPDFLMPFFVAAVKATDNNIDMVKLYAFYLEDINDPQSALPIWQAFLKAEPNNEVYKAKIKSLEAKIASWSKPQ